MNGLRAVSVAIVVWGHADLPVVIKGSTGVTVFFFISGYLITTLMMREQDRTGQISIRRFYARRALRIFPPLYIVLTVAVILTATGALAGAMTIDGVGSTVFYLTNYEIIVAGRDGLPGAMNALWSLAVEEHYYLLFPIVFVALANWLPDRRRQAVVLAAACVAVLGWRILLHAHGASFDRLYLSTDTRLDSILWGAVFALVATPTALRERLEHRRGLATAMLIVGTIAFYATSKRLGETTTSYTAESIALFLVFAAVIGSPESLGGRVLNWQPVVWVGVVSYAVYLIHRPALELADAHLPGPHALRVMAAVVVTLLLAEAMRISVERPLEPLRRRLGRERHQELPA